MSSLASHWEGVYSGRGVQSVSWYQARPETSLRLIADLGIGPADAVIDVGGGASSLVDHLVEREFGNVTVVDIAGTALDAARARLGAKAAQVKWLAGDILGLKPRGPFDLWHDRAVFHFLTGAAERARYVATLAAAVPAGGHAIMATFAEDGPERCSNLPVRRYSPEQLAAELGPDFRMIASLRETHLTPSGGSQNFIYCCFRRR